MRSSLLLSVTVLMALSRSAAAEGGNPRGVIYCSYDQNFSEPLLREFETRSGIPRTAVFDVERPDDRTGEPPYRRAAEPPGRRVDNGEFVQTLKLKQRAS